MKNTAREALIVVDYQNTFADKDTAELYVEGGEQISDEINNIMKDVKLRGGLIIASKDWHPQGHISFASNFENKDVFSLLTYNEVKNWTEENNSIAKTAGFSLEELKAYLENVGQQILWPDHGVEDSSGSEYQKDLDTSLIDIEVKKGIYADKDSYSSFGGLEINTNKNLQEILEEFKVEIIKVVGLASDYCVKETALSAAKNFNVEVLLKGTKAVDPENIETILEELEEVGIKIIK